VWIDKFIAFALPEACEQRNSAVHNSCAIIFYELADCWLAQLGEQRMPKRMSFSAIHLHKINAIQFLVINYLRSLDPTLLRLDNKEFAKVSGFSTCKQANSSNHNNLRIPS